MLVLIKPLKYDHPKMLFYLACVGNVLKNTLPLDNGLRLNEQNSPILFSSGF